ncbi:MAG TPA: two-component regulator propeller domain-containing protein, partial [Gammaproteobacteria bacterium]|nr:two-component regulator propeller domain-containing protein [Gammaproteobacteria bacterium]
MNRGRWMLAVALAFYATSAVAAHTFFDRIGSAQGLPEQTVTAIAQDATGFMWFGTQAGLARYDGYTFKVY